MATEQKPPLFLIKATRVYRPDEAPETVQQKACEHAAEYVEPSDLTDRICESVAEELEAHGVTLLRDGPREHKYGPWWQLDCQGSGVAANLSVSDLRRFARKRGVAPLRGIKALADSGHLSLTAKPGRQSYYTVAESEFSGNEHRPLAEALAKEWSEYVADLTRRMFKTLNDERDHMTSWEYVRESLEANDEGLSEAGHRVPLDRCRTLPATIEPPCDHCAFGHGASTHNPTAHAEAGHPLPEDASDS